MFTGIGEPSVDAPYFSGGNSYRGAGAVDTKLMMPSGVAVADSNIGLFDEDIAAVLTDLRSPSAYAIAIFHKIIALSPITFSSSELSIGFDPHAACVGS